MFFFSCVLPRPKNSMQLISNWIIICNFKSVAMARVYCVYEKEIEKNENMVSWLLIEQSSAMKFMANTSVIVVFVVVITMEQKSICYI